MPMRPSSPTRRTVSRGKRASRSMAEAMGRTSFSAKSRATAWIIFCSSVSSTSTMRLDCELFFEQLLEFLLQQGRDLEEVAHDAVVGDLEDRRLRVFVDGADHLGRPHARKVLDGARDAEAQVQLRRDGPPRLADLEAVRPPPGVHGGARGADG